MGRDFYPFVEQPASQEPENQGDAGENLAEAGFSFTGPVSYPARIAVYDDLAVSPRVVVIEPCDVRSFLEQITAKVTELSHAQGGTIPFMIIREIVENYIHAYFIQPTITILDGGNTIRFSDQGPGIKEKDRALEFGTSSATEQMKCFIRGVGSGLPLAQQYMMDKGGSLTIQDNINSGTIVTISTKSKQVITSPTKNHPETLDGLQKDVEDDWEEADYAQEAIDGLQSDHGFQDTVFPGQSGMNPNPGFASQGQPTPGNPGYLQQGYPQQQGTDPNQPWMGQGGTYGWQPGGQMPYPTYPPQGAQPQGWPGYPQAATPGYPYQQNPYGSSYQPGATPGHPGWQQPQVPGNVPGQVPGQMPGSWEPGGGGSNPFTSIQVSQRGQQILLYLKDHDSVGPSDMERLYGGSQPTWSRELNNLDKKGLLQKDGQKRYLTEVGRSYLQSLGQ